MAISILLPLVITFLVGLPIFFIGLYIKGIGPTDVFYGIKLTNEYTSDKTLLMLHKRYQKIYLISTISSTIFLLLLAFLFQNDWSILFLIVGLPFIFFFIMFFTYYKTYKKVKNHKQKQNWVIPNDDDEFYRLGMFYYNKNDKRKMVEKRMGAGLDFNYAHLPGKIAAVLIVAILVFVGYILVSQMQPNHYKVQSDKLVITGPYNQTVSFASIASVDLVKKLPHVKIKQNGSAVGKILKGRFKIKDFGSSTLYIANKEKPVIQITRKSGTKTIFINLKSETETKKLYQQLK